MKKKINAFLPKKKTFERHVKQLSKKQKQETSLLHTEELNRITRRFGNEVLKMIDSYAFDIMLNVPNNKDLPTVCFRFNVPDQYPSQSCEISIIDDVLSLEEKKYCVTKN